MEKEEKWEAEQQSLQLAWNFAMEKEFIPRTSGDNMWNLQVTFKISSNLKRRVGSKSNEHFPWCFKILNEG